MAQIRAGTKGEQEAAYHIDFHLKDSPNWAVIHDLRIEWNGRVAQIDHLLIDRFLEIYVVETKSLRTKVRYADGGWERLNFNRWEGIPSPVEQNDRHILVLKELIDGLQLAPTRLGVVLTPTFLNYVVVQPSCLIVGGLPKDVRIHRVDELVAVIRNGTPSALKIVKVIAPGTLMSFARHLVACHKPASRREPPINETDTRHHRASPDAGPTDSLCQGCGGPVTGAEAEYCLARKSRFAGQVLCRKCQKLAPVQVPASEPTAPLRNDKLAAYCAECGTGVDGKVLFFCRINGQLFGKRILCRKCQELVRRSPEQRDSSGVPGKPTD